MNPFQYIFDFVDETFPKGLFGYRFTYIIIRPHKILEEISYRIKWAFQRVYRGWDDRAVGSVDIWLSEIKILTISSIGVSFDICKHLLHLSNSPKWSYKILSIPFE